MGYLCIDFVAFSHGAGIHQWNVPLEYIPTYLKVWRTIFRDGAQLMIVGGTCQGSCIWANNIFNQALNSVTTLANICAETLWMGILLYPRPDLDEFNLLCDILLHRPLCLRPTTQNVGAPYSWTLL